MVTALRLLMSLHSWQVSYSTVNVDNPISYIHIESKTFYFKVFLTNDNVITFGILSLCLCDAMLTDFIMTQIYKFCSHKHTVVITNFNLINISEILFYYALVYIVCSQKYHLFNMSFSLSLSSSAPQLFYKFLQEYVHTSNIIIHSIHRCMSSNGSWQFVRSGSTPW